MSRHPRIAAAVLAAVLVGTSACTSTTRPDPTASATAAFDATARKAIAVWQKNPLSRQWRTAFIPLQTFTVPPAEAATASWGIRIAATHELLVPTVPLPTAAPPDGTITFADGGTMQVPLESAQSVYHDMVPHPDTVQNPVCTAVLTPPCDLTITHVQFGTTTILTSRGEAQVPAWLFTVAQLSEPIARVAVASSAVTPYTPNARDTWPGRYSDLDTTLTSVDVNRVSYTVSTGDNDPSVKPLAYETATSGRHRRDRA